MYVKNILHQVRTQNTDIISEIFRVVTRLKQGDIVILFIFNISLEKIIKKIRESLTKEIDVD